MNDNIKPNNTNNDDNSINHDQYNNNDFNDVNVKGCRGKINFEMFFPILFMEFLKKGVKVTNAFFENPSNMRVFVSIPTYDEKYMENNKDFLELIEVKLKSFLKHCFNHNYLGKGENTVILLSKTRKEVWDDEKESEVNKNMNAVIKENSLKTLLENNLKKELLDKAVQNKQNKPKNFVCDDENITPPSPQEAFQNYMKIEKFLNKIDDFSQDKNSKQYNKLITSTVDYLLKNPILMNEIIKLIDYLNDKDKEME